MSYANFLHRLSLQLAAQEQKLNVYDCMWQYHGVKTFFNYDADGISAGKVVVGITYDGKGNFSGTKAFNEWNDRVVWLKQKGVADLRYIAAGLSVDFEYNEAGVENRLKAKS